MRAAASLVRWNTTMRRPGQHYPHSDLVVERATEHQALIRAFLRSLCPMLRDEIVHANGVQLQADHSLQEV